MNLLDRAITFLAPGLGLRRQQARLAVKELGRISGRMYEAASHSHRTENWLAPHTSANTENYLGFRELRARSRDLVRNNPYAARAVSVWASNCIGHGIIPQIKCEDEKKREEIEQEWEAWAESTDCDFENRKTFYEMQSLVLRSVVESGEVLVRLWKRNCWEKPHFQLQILEADHLDTYRQGVTETTITQQGIEFSKRKGRTAYWLFPEHPGDTLSFGVPGITSFRISAHEILHIYRQDRPGQITGVPWAASLMTRLKDFDGYEDAQLRRQQIAASYAGFLEDIEPPMDVKMDSEGRALSKVTPGTIIYCPSGKRITFNNPPGAENYAEYSRQILHAISVGFGIPYESLTGDLSQVNFSSGRMGFLEFQRQLDHIRFHMFIPQFCFPIWNEFKTYLTLKGIHTQDVQVNWVPPRREMIDPVSEVKATTQAIRSGLISLNQAVTEFGVDPMDHYKELAAVNQVLDHYRLKLDSDPRLVNQVGADQPGESEETLNYERN